MVLLPTSAHLIWSHVSALAGAAVLVGAAVVGVAAGLVGAPVDGEAAGDVAATAEGVLKVPCDRTLLVPQAPSARDVTPITTAVDQKRSRPDIAALSTCGDPVSGQACGTVTSIERRGLEPVVNPTGKSGAT